MVEPADSHVDATHTRDGANGTGKGSKTRHASGTNGANGTNGTNGSPRRRIVVVGLGMVAVAFIEKLMKRDVNKEYHVTVVGEEPYVAYNRVGLSTFFEHRLVEDLYLNPIEWYLSIDKGRFSYHLDTRVAEIRPEVKAILTSSGANIPYDILVLATGSDAILPKSIPGHDARGVFLYRTILDLQHLIDFSSKNKGTTGVAVGGGLLGLEAAKAMIDLEAFSSVKIIERADYLLAKQLDLYAASLVEEKVRSLGLDVMAGRSITSINVDDGNNVTGATLENGQTLECSTICFAIGVRPNDDLAKSAQIKTGERTGGFVIDENLQTSVDDIYAIGDCACWHKQTFGIIAPGIEMADVLSTNLTAKSSPTRKFDRPDLSTKLKLLGIDVASFGDFFADVDGPSTKGTGDRAKALTYKDPFGAVYKKYLFTPDGKRLVGGMMIGDTRDYVKLIQMVRNRTVLEVEPSELILGANKQGEDDGSDLPDDTQVCSCHNVTKGDIVKTVKSGKCKTLDEVKACTKAGTGCGGCVPLVQSILRRALRDAGQEVSNNLCPHFPCSRADLYNVIAIKQLGTFESVMQEVGSTPHSLGCEICQPTVASILSSLFNEHVMARPHHALQETNDRFMANIQRNGTFSVVPRVPGGEITPRQLIVMGQVAEKYGLYCKVTGGQRIDLFGARKEDLLGIWGELVGAGMESGHAYAKALRTVKSCVGTNWCRYGVGDSVGMAIRLEERYKSIRAPHKIKGGVSGCVRECAEAPSKDFGLIATEKGFNIFVGGNGGAKPRHAELLAKDVPAEDVVPILDRYLIFYIRTADRLQRTARWIEGLPGGIGYLREVVLDDKLGICADMERQMQALVDSYFDEWAEILSDPARHGAFKQFNNTNETSEAVEIVSERGQDRPANWPKHSPTEDFKNHKWSSLSWEPLIRTSHFDGFSSAQVKRGDTQLAVFKAKGKFYATQQMCPHKRAFVLSDGMVCEDGGRFYVSCPLHKRNFELNGGEAGRCSSDGSMSVATFKVEARDDGWVYLKLPPVEELDAVLGTKWWKTRKGQGADFLETMDQKLNDCGKGRKGRKPQEVRDKVFTTHSLEW